MESKSMGKTLNGTNRVSEPMGDEYFEITSNEVSEDYLVEGPRHSKPREITIQPLDSGYIVRVGCQSIAIEKTQTVIESISKYLNDTANVERQWLDSSGQEKLNSI